MAGEVTLPNTFGTIPVTAQTGALDANFSALAASQNNLNNFDNEYDDVGTSGALAIVVPAPQVVTLQEGLILQIKVAQNQPTAGATLNITAGSTPLGAVNIVYPSTQLPMLPAQLVENAIIQLMYDGANFQYLGPIFGSGSFAGALTGFGSPPACAVNWSISAYHADLTFANALATSSGPTFGLSNLPSYLRPGRTAIIAVPDGALLDLASQVAVFNSGAAGIQTTGSSSAIAFLKNTNAGGWSATGSKGIYNAFSVGWSLI